MYKYQIGRDEVLTESTIAKIIQSFSTRVLPTLKKRRKYYDGQHPILNKQFENSTRPPNRIVTNFVQAIVDQYSGYGMGIPVRVSSGDKVWDDEINNVLKYNDYADQFNALYRNGLIYGRAALLNYIDMDGKIRFESIPTESFIPVVSDDVEEVLLYVIRFWECKNWVNDQTSYFVEVYDNKMKSNYTAAAGYTSVHFIGAVPHNFNQCPVCVFSLNREEEGHCDKIFTLNDAYNTIQSDMVDGEDAFADAMLVLTGAFADEDDIDSMKRNRVLMLDQGSTASYLTKNGSDTQGESLLVRIENKIRELCSAPDFNDESFGAASGVSIRYKLLGMENKTVNYITGIKKTIQKEIELICGVEKLLSGEDAVWRDAEITFTRDIPVSEVDNANVVTQLQGIVSNKTLFKLLPFITDPEAEEAAVAEQNNKDMELYSKQFESRLGAPVASTEEPAEDDNEA